MNNHCGLHLCLLDDLDLATQLPLLLGEYEVRVFSAEALTACLMGREDDTVVPVERER